MNLQAGFTAVLDAQLARFRPYTFRQPMVLSAEKYQETRQLGLILHKIITHVVENYTQYLHLMPFSEQDVRMLDVCSRHPYRVGTFRTDFIIDTDSQVRIIEITARQPLNGYFLSGVLRHFAMEQAKAYGIDGIIDVYPTFYSYLERYIGDARHICVVKGNERMGEFKDYPKIFEQAGITCHVIPIDQLSDSLSLLEGAWVIEELNHKEIRQFPLEIIDTLTRARMHNDIRTVFFAHDKRFFRLLSDSAVLDNAISPAEQTLLRKYMVPTYVYGEYADVWEDAYHHRDGYIMKHHLLGKSEQVYAGRVTDESQWKALFDTSTVEHMVLQPFIEQRKFTGVVGNEQRDDYVAGTLLYFNEEFFGPGLYRASSFPVTNQADDRKIAPLVATVNQQIPGVNYI